MGRNLELVDELTGFTPKEQQFINSYLDHGNGMQAAIEAGYARSGAAVRASELLKKPRIRRYIRSKLVHFKLTRNAIVEQLYYLATRDARDYIDPKTGTLLPLNKLGKRARACIDGFKQKQYYKRNAEGDEELDYVETEVKLSPKATAIDISMKFLGEYKSGDTGGGGVVVNINWGDMVTTVRNDGEDAYPVRSQQQKRIESSAPVPVPTKPTKGKAKVSKATIGKGKEKPAKPVDPVEQRILDVGGADYTVRELTEMPEEQ
jgi:hypothetical protein